MLILFDQASQVPIRDYLQEHTISTAFQHGWSKLKNGELLEAAERAGVRSFLDNRQEHPSPAKARWPENRHSGDQSTAVATTSGSRPGGC
jgi:hypothetical protein